MSIFNEFPYTNFHELNLDWILGKVKDLAEDYIKMQTDVRDLKTMFEGLRKYVNDYFMGLDVQDEINAKLDEMYENGDLERIVNRAYFFNSEEVGWKVRRIGNSYICSINKTETSETEPYLLGQDAPINVPYCWFTPYIRWILPMPLKNCSAVSQADTYFGTGINNDVVGVSTFEHRLLFFARDLPEGAVTVNSSIHVMGERQDPLANAPTAYDATKAAQIVALAKSYYDARVAGRVYGYGPNFVTYRASNIVNNAQGSAMMECDTLVALVMLGISYENSPYADTTPGLTYNFEDLTINPDNYNWTLPWAYNDIVGRKVTYTGAENWYYWTNAMVFSDMAQVQPGDVAIFRQPRSNFFDNITHTGIIDKQGDELWIYHITDAAATGSNMAYEPLQNVIERKQYRPEEGELYFARVYRPSGGDE